MRIYPPLLMSRMFPLQASGRVHLTGRRQREWGPAPGRARHNPHHGAKAGPCASPL